MPNGQVEIQLWEDSYTYVAARAGEQEISACITSDLEEAHALMEPCNEKPPAFSIELSVREQLWKKTGEQLEQVAAYCERLILEECFRYPMVCRELSRRFHEEHPDLALSFLESALLPGGCPLAFADEKGYAAWWKENSNLEDWRRRSEELAVEIRNLSVKHSVQHRQAAGEKYWNFVGEFAVYRGMVGAAFRINQQQDGWNFWLKASMVPLLERLERHEKAQQIREECLDALNDNDELWKAIFDRAIDTRVATRTPPEQAGLALTTSDQSALISPQQTGAMAIEQVGALLSGMSALHSQLMAVRTSTEQTVRITQSLHDRLDAVVEKLIDLDQRSELTWEEIKRSAQAEPDYQALIYSIETTLAGKLGATWTTLEPESRTDLVDAEFALEECKRRTRGWRMPVLGYAVVLERELEKTRVAWASVAPGVGDQGKDGEDTLGALIKNIELLGNWFHNLKSMKPSRQALTDRLDQLWRFNKLRIRAAHAAGQGVSRKDASWVREILIEPSNNSLLRLVLEARA